MSPAPESDRLLYTDVHARRVERDAYWTEPACTEALLRSLAALSPRGVAPLPHRIWEPCCGANWIAAELEARGYDVVGSDIQTYDGSVGHRELRRDRLLCDFLEAAAYEPFGEAPYAIVTNPPFDDDLAEACLRMALAKPNAAVVWFLLKNEFDTSNTNRPDLFERDDYAMKIVLRWRPLWSTPAGPIVSERTGKAGGARQHYAWFGWFRNARQRWPGARIVYADRSQDLAQRAAPRSGDTAAGKLPTRPPSKHWQDRED